MIIQVIFSNNSCMGIQLLVSVKDSLFPSIRLLFRSLGRNLLINTASIYKVLFSRIQLLLKKDSFITPASIYAALFSFIQLPFMQYCFHHSRFYLCSVVFITPASVYTVFFSFIHSGYFYSAASE